MRSYLNFFLYIDSDSTTAASFPAEISALDRFGRLYSNTLLRRGWERRIDGTRWPWSVMGLRNAFTSHFYVSDPANPTG